MERILDLPAHPLLIHFPAVAIPVLALMAIVLVAMPKFRSQWRLLTIVLAVAVVVTTFLAAASGEALADAISFGEQYDELISDHKTLGETLRFFVLGLGLTVIALVILGSPDRAHPIAGGGAIALNVLVVAFAILSLVWAFRTGHEGARIHWDGILPADAAAHEVN